jgi:hypothetical protein
MHMGEQIRNHIRSNVVGYVAVFLALTGSAYAIDGPLPGQNQVGSEDIINNEVRNDNIGTSQVRTGDVANEHQDLAGRGLGIQAEHECGRPGSVGRDQRAQGQ